MKPVKYTSRYKKDAKKAKGQGRDFEELRTVISLLRNGKPLPDKYLDHPLRGKLKDYRDCHVENDWVLIYGYSPEGELILVRIGSHAELYG